MLAFSDRMCYYTLAVRRLQAYPGVAKFGIALEWGSRGLEFESRHSDQKAERANALSAFFFSAGEIQKTNCKSPNRFIIYELRTMIDEKATG